MATKRPDGRYHATWTHPLTKQRMYEYGATAQEADQNRDRARSEADREAASGPTPSVDLDLHTLAGLLWYPRIEGQRPNTIRRYRDAYDRHVRPTFGETIPADIRPADVQRWINAMNRKGVAANSVILYKSILSSILKLCHAEGLIPSNPATVAKTPKKPRRIRTLPLSDLRILLGKVEGTELACPVFLAAVLGMSRGELCGLKWKNVDSSRRRISITEQRLVRQGETKGKSIGEGPTKRDSRVRSFALPPGLWDALMRVASLDSDYVCAKATNKPWNPEHLTWEWAKAREGLGLKEWTFHDLRHGAAGVLAALEVDLLTIAAILGHRNIDMTQLYAAAQESTATAGLERLAEALFPSSKQVDEPE
jgi:integrase